MVIGYPIQLQLGGHCPPKMFSNLSMDTICGQAENYASSHGGFRYELSLAIGSSGVKQ